MDRVDSFDSDQPLGALRKLNGAIQAPKGSKAETTFVVGTKSYSASRPLCWSDITALFWI